MVAGDGDGVEFGGLVLAEGDDGSQMGHRHLGPRWRRSRRVTLKGISFVAGTAVVRNAAKAIESMEIEAYSRDMRIMGLYRVSLDAISSSLWPDGLHASPIRTMEEIHA